MQTGLYVSLSSQLALDRRLTTLADNVANSTTVGFRATEVKFNQVVSDQKVADVAFVSQGNEFLSTRAGGMTETGGTLDFAIKGDAWFQVETPSGPTLTRDGRFTLTDAGELVTLNGYAVLDAGGGPIQLDAANGPILLSADGQLNQNGQPIAALGLFSADLSGGFTRAGNSGIITTIAPEPVVDRLDAGVVQGYVEESNVNAIGEMTQLIQVTRAFESIASLLRDSEESMNEAVRTLGGSR
ncbi:flagellar basal-body rod protein FlgF [Shinella kummerowiae]|jgi:flagellar basal-body rod protein FlgF|uniref:Flagellar basal-body rod protein FlgF n=1 Tax=Shinella kummerowiae TaxID=417745 RepID=A0A6N8SB60_9HYPH|nr:flagellar basal-body rod protein FlgF [Shinella kummerowiae]MCT7665888.1 flagellar basal-body rod protein FlgF [Shinella kummerowiae]MXN44536.1 flagellar basal-body rod protein FlgF [Shinella kummerowiae]